MSIVNKEKILSPTRKVKNTEKTLSLQEIRSCQAEINNTLRNTYFHNKIGQYYKE